MLTFRVTGVLILCLSLRVEAGITSPEYQSYLSLLSIFEYRIECGIHGSDLPGERERALSQCVDHQGGTPESGPEGKRSPTHIPAVSGEWVPTARYPSAPGAAQSCRE